MDFQRRFRDLICPIKYATAERLLCSLTSRQVLSSTVNAQYIPAEAQGTLYIRLGKPLPSGVPAGERVIHSYVIPANPDSKVNRVVVHVDQGHEAYRFYPGPATKYILSTLRQLNDLE